MRVLVVMPVQMGIHPRTGIDSRSEAGMTIAYPCLKKA